MQHGVLGATHRSRSGIGGGRTLYLVGSLTSEPELAERRPPPRVIGRPGKWTDSQAMEGLTVPEMTVRHPRNQLTIPDPRSRF